MTTLSTHVLDTERGTPAAGVPVALFRGQQRLARVLTNQDGRIPDLSSGPLDAGSYRIVFELAGYLEAHGRPAPFLQLVSVDFRVDAQVPHYHIPLLVSPYACTTYRGS